MKNVLDSVPAISVRDLHKRYGDLYAVQGVSFDVARGEVFGMLGPNGAGKTTTVEIIEGLRAADSGTVTVLGHDVARQPRQVKERIGVQLQAPALPPRLKVRELLDLFAGFFTRARPTDELIRLVGLEESRERLADTLSGGQAQRLSVAIALINQPEILFLDEPTTGLDPQARANLWDVIASVRDGGATVVLTTHYMEEAERLCDRVAIIDHGQIIALDTPRALIDSNFSETTVRVRLPNAPLDSARMMAGVTHAQTDEDELVLYSADVPATMVALLGFAQERGIALEGLAVRGATLEDVFLKLTGRSLRE